MYGHHFTFTHQSKQIARYTNLEQIVQLAHVSCFCLFAHTHNSVVGWCQFTIVSVFIVRLEINIISGNFDVTISIIYAQLNDRLCF